MTPVFVFGSNLAGRHGKGAALFAREEHGAIYGQAEGRQGNSYAIPTKNAGLQSLTLEQIKPYMHRFLMYVYARPEETFEFTPVDCGLAGHSVPDMWKLVNDQVDFICPNILFTKDWLYGLTTSSE